MANIIYDANGGTGEPTTQTATAGTTVALSNTEPSRENETNTWTVTYDGVEEGAVLSKNSDTVSVTTQYTFAAWNTRADGTGTNYYPEQSFKVPTADTRLYAVWTATRSGSVSLPTGTLERYLLQGFSPSTTDITYVANPFVPTSNVTLYAVWSLEGSGGYIKIPSNTDLTLNPGDKVFLTGFHHPQNDGRYTVAAYHFEDNTMKITFMENFAYSGSQDAEEEQLTIYGNGLYVPDMDYICSLNNRLWGCSNRMRTIYASSLGDPTDFWTFAGDSLDAYQVAVGSSGDFTGACAMNNNVLFFKQHTIHKMMGNFPAEYQLYTYDIDGTSETNGLSAINCDGTVIFVTEHGIGTYSGAYAGSLSKELGEGNMNNALAMFNGEQYYLYFEDDQQQPHTYIFDMRYNLWVEADFDEILGMIHLKDRDYVLSRDTEASGIRFVADNGNTVWDSDGSASLSLVDEDSDTVWVSTSGTEMYLFNEENRRIWPRELQHGTVYWINSGEEYTGEWEIIFKPFYEATTGSWNSKSHIFEKKRYTGITFRLELPEGSWIKAELRTDRGNWHPIARAKGTKVRVMDFVVRTPRIDKAQLRLSGEGDMTILGIEREYTVGSRR